MPMRWRDLQEGWNGIPDVKLPFRLLKDVSDVRLLPIDDRKKPKNDASNIE